MSNKATSNVVSEKLESSQAHAKKALNSTTSAAREIASSAGTVAKSAYRESKEELSAAARDVGHAARATCSSLAEQTSAMREDCCDRYAELEAEVTEYVREKPLQSVGIAFGIGFIIGIILNRK